MAETGLLLSYYGDDLTGSTDVMEALELGGVPTVLFTGRPDASLVARFGHCRAMGLAGTSRSETPAWMDENLTPAFEWLRSLNAAISHYKVCSTFDSSPEIGNIGRAIEIGRKVFGQDCVPLLVGAPQLKRYTAFGNLFAGYRGRTYRIDRHPVMSRHPVTPMREADLLKHLAEQTAMTSALVDITDLRLTGRAAIVDRVRAESDFFLIDVDGPETQLLAGEELWRVARAEAPFVVGSSGIEYALLRHWAAAGIAPGTAAFAPAAAVDRLAVVSGSVSPTTERQIGHAVANGYVGIELDPLALVGENAEAAIAGAVAAGQKALRDGRSVVLYSALGPNADRGSEIDRVEGARHRLGRALGTILRDLVRSEGLRRAVIAGGDTSSHALGQLGIAALTVRMPLPQSPGSPLCVAHSGDAGVDGLEIALKGGQVGTDAYFEAIRLGERL
ncbi:MAG: four-carbon acid sugar kinase family protein [Rhizobiaceae bacterium]|nr:four-carbon acid sugar kinase family protein [Rhizobiaceae bacterium]